MRCWFKLKNCYLSTEFKQFPWKGRQKSNLLLIISNAIQKTAALSSFKDSDSEVKVILLSLSKAASGSNLIQASHVVLIDPISGTKEEVKAIEQQAIGRAYRQGQAQQVTVVRFLIKDTKEHMIYLRINTPESTDNTGN